MIPATMLATGAAGGADGAGGLVPLGYGWALLKVLLVLLVVCGLIYLLFWLLRRYLARPGQRPGTMQVVDRFFLAPRQSLWVIRIANRTFLIGATDGSVTRLAELEPTGEGAEPDPAAGAGPGPGFREVLSRVRGIRAADREGR